jgi:hypothetical protein
MMATDPVHSATYTSTKLQMTRRYRQMCSGPYYMCLCVCALLVIVCCEKDVCLYSTSKLVRGLMSPLTGVRLEPTC